MEKEVVEECCISVIIPVYNVYPFLSEALDSVVNQSYPNLEIILVDDGSTDGSGNVCDTYASADERIKIIHQENKGLSTARNVGLNMATGDAVVFLDSDDKYHQDYVKNMLVAMVLEKADLVVCKFATSETSKKMEFGRKDVAHPLIGKGIYGRKECLCELVNNRINNSVWNKMYKRKLWDGIRFPDGHIYEDLDTTFRIINKCDRVCVIEEILYLYRKRNGSIINSVSTEKINDRLLARSHLDSFIIDNIPELFSVEQWNRRRQRKLRLLLIYYSQLSICRGKEEKALFHSLKKEIHNLRQELKNRKNRFSVTITEMTMYYFPWLWGYSFYIHKEIKKVLS